ncbi:hypothetical protein D3C75_463070 [compost metagenome]
MGRQKELLVPTLILDIPYKTVQIRMGKVVFRLFYQHQVNIARPVLDRQLDLNLTLLAFPYEVERHLINLQLEPCLDRAGR